MKSAIRRLRDAARICFDKSKYEKSLTSLRDRTSELTQLRAHIGAFQQQQICSESVCASRRILPSCIKSIRTASQKPHEALSDAWCCGDLNHETHFAKICLDAQVEEVGVRLDLTISCQQTLQQSTNRCVSDLLSRSISVEITNTNGSPGCLLNPQFGCMCNPLTLTRQCVRKINQKYKQS
jgi:hypothetical protein